MAFERWSYQFDGPYNFQDSLQSQPGVYVILCRRGDDWNVLDVGESEDVRDRVRNHERTSCWSDNCFGSICYLAMYMPDSTEEERREIELRIRIQTTPPCGEL